MNKIYLGIIGVFLFIGLTAKGQTNNYFGTTGTLNGNSWNTMPAGPYTSALVTAGGSILNFNNAAIATGATISTMVGINFGATITWTAGGTIGAAGINLPINISNGIIEDIGLQVFSSSATAAINKTGPGILAIGTGGTYAGGFTLSAGGVIVKGINALGNGSLNLNAGFVASDANHNLSGKYTNGITIGGDIQFGEIPANVAIASNTAILTFSNNMALGGVNRTLTLGNAGTINFGGIVSGTGGIVYTSNTNGVNGQFVLSGVNTYTGATSINGGTVSVGAINNVSVAGNLGAGTNLIFGGGKLLFTGLTATTDRNFTLTSGTTSTIDIATAGTVLTMTGAASATTGALTKAGAGTLLLSGSNQYTGSTNISAGTLAISADERINDLSALSVSGTFDLNSHSERVGSLAGAGIVTTSVAGSVALNTGGDNISTNFSGIIQNGSGTVAFTKSGSGTLSLTGINTYTGATHINNGTLQLNKSGSPTIPVSQSVTVNTGGTLQISQNQTLANVTLTTGSTLTVDAGKTLIITGTLTVNPGVTINGVAGAIVYATGLQALVYTGSGSITSGIEWPTSAVPNTVNINSGITVLLAANKTTTTVLTVDGTLNTSTYSITGGAGTVNINGTLITGNLATAANGGGFMGTGSAFTGATPILGPSSTIEYNALAAQAITTSPSYVNLILSGGGTKTTNNVLNIFNNLTISDPVTFDAANHTVGGATTNLIMTGASRFRMSGTSPKPDIDGTYALTGGTIEFYNTLAGVQRIKGKTNANLTSIIYKNIEVTGTNVGTSNDNIYLNDAAGSFTVKNGATFSISSPTIRASSSTNTSTVTVENNAIFKTGNNVGFSGTTEGFGKNSSIHSNIAAANISLIAGSTVDYISPAGQEISNQIPYQHLTISAMDGTEKAPSATLSILGNFTKSGSSIFDHNNGTVLLNGTTQSFAGVTYNNLWLDNAGSKTLSGNAVVIDSLKIGNITTDPVTNLTLGTHYLTLQSTAAKTARLATVAPNATITYSGAGRFIVQRNIPPQRAWRLVTAPVVADATKTVFNAWQRGGATGSLTTAGTGLFISGPLAPAGGLDITPKGNYSLKLYNGVTLTGVDNTTAITISGTESTPGIPVNYGMFLFVRGDRSSNALFYPPYKNETTLSDTGMVQIKTQTFSLSGPTATGYSLVGNPYASEVDMSMVMASGVNIDKNKYYMYDPFINLEQGGYLTYFKNTNTGLFESAPISPGGQKNNVYSSQAFYVLRTATGATLTFTENNKSSATPSAMFRPMTTTQSFRTNLYILNTDTTILADGNITLFNAGYLNEPYKDNILKFTNIKENLGLLRNGKIYAVENLNPITLTDTLFLNLLKTTIRNYQFEFVPQNIDPILTAAVLDDSYTGIKTPISLEAASRFTFSINADTASAASSRFRLIFRALPVARIPVTFTSIKAIRQKDDITVQWAVINELNIREYEIEKSLDGQHFTKVNNTVANGLANKIEYSWLDKNALQGDNFFRIKSVANNGDVVYSSIVKLKFATGQSNGISIYTNPVTDGIIGLQLLNQPQGIYQFRLLNNLGQLILSRSINYTGASRVTLTTDKVKFVTGNYHLQVVKPDKTTRDIKVFIQIK